MKIVFLCGSLQPGADGVGDYTRRLAGELIRQRHQAGIVALHDKAVDEKKAGVQCSEQTAVPVLRLPATWKTQRRFAEAGDWIAQENPGWLSLQFVPFSFHAKGLPWQLGSMLSTLGKGRNWHLMFHELWTGMGENDTGKQKLLGRLQQQIVARLLQKLQPSVVHTQCPLYVEKLHRFTQEVQILPLFSNVSFRQNINHNRDESRHRLRFVFFGGLHPQAKLDILLAQIKKMNKHAVCEFIYAGRNGSELDTHVRMLREQQFSYRILGELGAEEISAVLTDAYAGVSTTSPEVIEKSGSVAAMLEHGLPVICIGREVKVRNFRATEKTAAGIYSLEEVEQLLQQRPNLPVANRLPMVASTFLNSLQAGRINQPLAQPLLAERL